MVVLDSNFSENRLFCVSGGLSAQGVYKARPRAQLRVAAQLPSNKCWTPTLLPPPWALSTHSYSRKIPGSLSSGCLSESSVSRQPWAWEGAEPWSVTVQLPSYPAVALGSSSPVLPVLLAKPRAPFPLPGFSQPAEHFEGWIACPSGWGLAICPWSPLESSVFLLLVIRLSHYGWNILRAFKVNSLWVF